MAILQGNAKSSGAGGFYTKTIDQSLRLNDNDAAYLTRTPSSAGNRKTWTWSGWVKLGNLYMSLPTIFSADYGSQGFNLTTDFDTLRIYNYTTSYNLHLTSSLKIRDPSAWYHIVVAMDTTQATASDRVKVYLNGTQITNFATEIYPSQNFETQVNAAVDHNFSKYSGQAGSYFDGYLAEVHLTDGTAYDADTFGELKSGIWIPKSPSVTYGTNGFYLDFANSADIGNDVSGNNNDWTVNNLVASDVVPDSPTNNFCTWNPLDQRSVTELKEGNLKLEQEPNYEGVRATFQIPPSGKWYFEGYVEEAPSGSKPVLFGLADKSVDVTVSPIGLADNFIWALEGDRKIRVDGTTYSPVISGVGAAGDILQVAIDVDNNEIYFGYNNTWYQTNGGTAADPSTGTNPTVASYDTSLELFPYINMYNNHLVANFGQDSTFAGLTTAGGNTDANGIGDFKYAPPSGYLALCTNNLPDPVIDPAQDVTPEDHFNVVTYSGNSSSLGVTGVGFEPDFTWIKNLTSTSDYHTFFDKVRGTNGSYYSFLLCPYTGTEDYAPQGGNGGFGAIETFDTDGFTLDSSNSDWSRTNESGQDYVAYNWTLPTTVSGSTAGVGTSQSYTGRVNADAGVSIIAYSGNNDGGHKIPHHLNEAPEFVICKGRTYLQGWPAYHAYQDITNPEDIYLELNTTDYRNQDDVRFWNDTKPDSTHVTLGTIAWLNGSGYDYVMYSFHSVDGFSKVGQFTGNGSTTDGPFVYTGFRPKWVMIKQVSSAGWGWYIFDSERSPYNDVDDYVNTASVAGEVANSTTANIDFLSNGFKLRGSFQGTNENLMDFSYLCFAEQPFKYSNAR